MRFLHALRAGLCNQLIMQQANPFIFAKNEVKRLWVAVEPNDRFTEFLSEITGYLASLSLIPL
ncbi:hypothetical protein [Paenibacillus eucommiae]|uniref:Uncharacterized protein n=1 Tax=Paenibacillus eucommiae TaxID=1355755 RepID=A0ABS4J9S1_9BACL|nr:hypothetical protein [Paenibacillus eucommiae]MBP1996587.1 hypothetical protein [Paenibacillus eucommiae]